ncbi:hypothetical protein LAZ40_07230 [Cereibacter sphaeroides]|uniref:hypothetical protein n=1 Tax=Cereibacter sphaeroides TaxID=1063 RepID=UPI001F1AF8EC|nr:hypothetical protein [Cereibacter sphaeroides]MCE6958840.1 hypothetical protein [Cereibacter sphaeroides]MCE6973286.1 hypothetical protein [Cereibacter sphaeroides]
MDSVIDRTNGPAAPQVGGMTVGEARRAHNATLPVPIPFRGQHFFSLTTLARTVVPAIAVGERTLAGRLHRGLERHGQYADTWIEDALYLDANAFRQKYGVRRTWVTIDGVKTDAAEIYALVPGERVAWNTVWQRLHRRSDLTMEIVREAMTLPFEDWNTHYGTGGRRKGFRYTGDLHPDARGEYTAVSSFLKKVGRYGDYQAIKARLSRGWDIDDALTRPPIERDGTWSLVYTITQISTGRQYVGLSVRGERSRWMEHLKWAFEENGSTPLYCAMRETGRADFRMDVVEEGVMSSEMLADRERAWIEALGTMAPCGFNSARGGGIGRVEGVPVTVDGVTYVSREAAARALAEETGLPQHVVLKRLLTGQPLPERARRHSRHPEAGTILFRKWLGLRKRAADGLTAELVDAWADYDTWKRDTQATGKEDLDLYRPERSAPWGPDNFAWGTATDRVTSIHGREIRAFGRTWPSKAAACKDHGIGVGTFNFRLENGMSVEEALTAPLAATSRKGQAFDFEGESFRSMGEAARVLAERHGVTREKARDRIRRGIGTGRWLAMAQAKHVTSSPG